MPTMVEISLIRALTSRAWVLLERKRLSFASRQGCLETCTLAGSDMLRNERTGETGGGGWDWTERERQLGLEANK